MTLPVGSAANSSLGAVGGARGTAAGALRILVEFLTQYDSKAVKALEADLNSLSSQEQTVANQQLSAERTLNTAKQKRIATEKELARLVSLQAKPGGIRRELREIQNIGVQSKEGQKRLTLLDKQLGLGGQLVRLQTTQAKLRATELGAATKINRLEFVRKGILEQEVAQQKQLTAFQNLKAAVPGKLAGLALGAVGGIVGGAVLGVGFAAAEAALEKIGTAIQDLLDPSRHAKEALKEVGKAINEIAANEENAGDRREATIQYLKELGIAADEATIKLLEQAAATQTGRDALDARGKLFEITSHAEELHNKLLEDTINHLIQEAKVRGDLVTTTVVHGRAMAQVADHTYYAARAEEFLAEAEQAAALAARQAASEAQNLEAARRAQAGAAQLAAYAEQNLSNIIASATAGRTGPIDSRIDALRNAGDSARTKAIQDKIDALQSGGGGGDGGARAAELRNIAEERAIILLRMKLRLLGTNIDLEKYSGKFLLEAIEAKQRALQKEADAQDRLNRLLDLQFRMSQTIRRNEGETISDFLERRAQENRDMLSEQRDIERETVEERLEELKAKTQDEVDLAELSERSKNRAAKGGSDNRIRLLQKELAASREADRKAVAAKIAALEKQKKAHEELAATVEEYSKQATNDQIREALRAAETIQDLAILNGQAAGLSAAYFFLQALRASGTLNAAELREVTNAINRISSTLSSLESRRIAVAQENGIRHFAEGGIISLNNASSPFGSNVRFGEQGTEALVLQHKVAESLKGQGRTGDIGPFYVNRSDNALRDKYELKRTVREAVQEALR